MLPARLMTGQERELHWVVTWPPAQPRSLRTDVAPTACATSTSRSPPVELPRELRRRKPVPETIEIVKIKMCGCGATNSRLDQLRAPDHIVDPVKARSHF